MAKLVVPTLTGLLIFREISSPNFYGTTNFSRDGLLSFFIVFYGIIGDGTTNFGDY